MSALGWLRAASAQIKAAHDGLLHAPQHTATDAADLTDATKPTDATAGAWSGRTLGVMALGALVIVVFHYQGVPEALLKRWPSAAEASPPWAWVWSQLYIGAVSAALHLGIPLGAMALGWARLKGAPLGDTLSPAKLWALCGGLVTLLTLASPVMTGAYWALPPGEVVEGAALAATLGVWLLRALATEVFFRGLLVLGTRQALGVSGAVGLSLIPYTMIHYHLALPQVLIGWVVGVGLGWLAAKRGSIWLGVCLHCGAVLARTAWTGGVG